MITDAVRFSGANPDWVDEEAVHRSLAGHAVGRPLTRAERGRVVRELSRREWSDSRIAERMSMHTRQVRAHLADGGAR